MVAVFAAVNFVECPKCDKRMRISEDGREAFVNLCRIDATRKNEMKVRAERLLARAKPVAPANPLTPLKRLEMASKPFLADIAPESFEAGHMVLTVAPGGKTYNLAYVTADDESMKVTGAYDFTSKGNTWD